jgi:hypothetical protein
MTIQPRLIRGNRRNDQRGAECRAQEFDNGDRRDTMPRGVRGEEGRLHESRSMLIVRVPSCLA